MGGAGQTGAGLGGDERLGGFLRPAASRATVAGDADTSKELPERGPLEGAHVLLEYLARRDDLRGKGLLHGLQEFFVLAVNKNRGPSKTEALVRTLKWTTHLSMSYKFLESNSSSVGWEYRMYALVRLKKESTKRDLPGFSSTLDEDCGKILTPGMAISTVSQRSNFVSSGSTEDRREI